MSDLAWELVCMIGLAIFVVGYIITMFACLFVEYVDERSASDSPRDLADDDRGSSRHLRMVETRASGGVTS